MEKFGLFDLIDKFNASASGKNDFTQREKSQQSAKAEDKSSLVDPGIEIPQHYLMNAKLTAFHKKHDAVLKQISSQKKR